MMAGIVLALLIIVLFYLSKFIHWEEIFG
jgi:hypothetical protein